MDNRVLILVAFLSTTFIYAINLWFSISGFYLFFITLTFLLILIFFNKKFPIDNINYTSCLLLCVFLFSIFSFGLEATDVNGQLSLAMWLNRLLMFLVILLIGLYFFKKPGNKFLILIYQRKFIILLLMSFLIQLTLLRIVRVPDVDIYNIVKYGSLRFANGISPYDSPGTNPSLQFNQIHYEFYTYGPASVLLFLPFVILFQEPRILLIVCHFIVIYCLYKLSLGSKQTMKEAQLLVLLYLFHPRYPNFLMYSVTDVVIVGLLALAIWLISIKKIKAAAITLALLVGTKIFYGIPLIFLLKYKSLNKMTLIIFGMTTITLIYLPFLLMNPRYLIESTVTFHLLQVHTLELQQRVVTFASFLNRQWNVFPSPIYFLIANISLIVIFWFLIRPTDKLDRIMIVTGLVFITSIFFSQQALPGYYFVGSFFLLLALALSKNTEVISGSN